QDHHGGGPRTRGRGHYGGRSGLAPLGAVLDGQARVSNWPFRASSFFQTHSSVGRLFMMIATGTLDQRRPRAKRIGLSESRWSTLYSSRGESYASGLASPSARERSIN